MTSPQRTLEHRRGKPRLTSLVRARVLDGESAGKDCAAATSVAVGTADDNQLILKDATVSRYHLVLEATDRGIHLRDLGSRNGTYVGDVRVHDAYVPAKTAVRIGQTQIEVDAGPTMAASPSADAEIEGLIGSSAAMREIRHTVTKLAQSDVTTLIQGETGTGKEVVAQAIHSLSSRKDKPLVVVDCGSIPHTLIASELFGHERGAFTGATQRRIGAFETAHGGTIFLDEIGELPPQVQPALLGVLERKRFRRVGGRDEVKVDVRVLAATHRELRQHVNEGRFRPDLYFRLAVARIEVPPLRDRIEDVDSLVSYFVEQISGIPDPDAFSPALMQSLRNHRFTGNVRELRNIVESGLAFGTPQMDSTERSDATSPSTDPSLLYKDARARALDSFERSYLEHLMTACAHNASKAAREARMDRPYLLSLLRRHGLR